MSVWKREGQNKRTGDTEKGRKTKLKKEMDTKIICFNNKACGGGQKWFHRDLALLTFKKRN